MKKILTNNILKNYLILTISLFGIEMIFKAVENTSVLDWSSLRIFIGISIISLFLSILL